MPQEPPTASWGRAASSITFALPLRAFTTGQRSPSRRTNAASAFTSGCAERALRNLFAERIGHVHRTAGRIVLVSTPSSRVIHLRAIDLTNRAPGYLFRERGESDDAWKRVKERVVCESRPHDGSVLPEVCTVTFTDGTERYFNPDDPVEIRLS